MMRLLTARTLQPFRRLVLWLTGNHALHEKMDALNQLLVAMPHLIEAATERAIASEVGRPDGLLMNHINALRADINVLRTDFGGGVRDLHTMVDNMHLISLHEKMDALWTVVHALPNESADAVGKQLIEEMDRLDGNILHHMAALRVVLLANRQSDEASAGRVATRSELEPEST